MADSETRLPSGIGGSRLPIHGLLIVVSLLSIGLLGITFLNYRTAYRVAEETLRNQGIAIGLELAAEARGRGATEAEALQALLSEQQKREVAFLAIVERDGTVLAHTNPRLVDSRLQDGAFMAVRDTGQLRGALVMLATGEEVYELTMPFHVPPTGTSSALDVRQPRFRILRIALHTAPARQIVYQAQAQVLFVGVLVVVLLGLSTWQVRTLRRYLRLREEAAQQERLAALGGMAAVLAHEIRNPLGAIKGLAQFLAEKQTEDPAHTEMTQAIASEATRLERLVNDLLTYARPRPPERLPTDVAGSLREVLAWVRPLAEPAGVALRLKAPDGAVQVHADPEQLKQLFSNLVLNGLQAMPQGGALTVGMRAPGFETGGEIWAREAHGAARDGEGIEVSITDTGPGIPEADLPRIFEPFYTTRTKGTGLGLAICRQIVEAHGGTIRVGDTGPQGTTILVTLPGEMPDHG